MKQEQNTTLVGERGWNFTALMMLHPSTGTKGEARSWTLLRA